MGILSLQRQRKDLSSTVQALRSSGIEVSGPYRRRNGSLMFSVGEHVVTEEELLGLRRDERLEPHKVHEILNKIKKRPT